MVHIPSAKTVVPSAPVGFVSRPRLLDLLDTAPDGSLVLVCAPPGYGKTSLLADWVGGRVAAASAWLTLDDDDNDPRRLWIGVLMAVTGSVAGALDGLLAHPPESVSELSEEILNALDGLPEPVRLVVDNVDQLVAPPALDVLRLLVRHRPSGLRLVLSSRLDPPLSLPRLRLEGRLHEIRVDQLRFSRAEARKMIEVSGARLSDSQIAALHGLTEGWAAALRLATISLRNTPDAEASLAAFSGDEHSVAEYLVDEILSGFSKPVREFLGAISVCDVFPPELAAVLSGRQDAAELLNRLERESSVVARVDPRRALYRMQPLLRSYLRADLERGEPAHVAALHAEAASWWADHDDPVLALEHVDAAAHRPLVVALIRRFALRLVAAGAHPLLRRALRQVNEEARRRDPFLGLASALCHVEAGEPARAKAALEQAERRWPDEPTPSLELLQALARTLFSYARDGLAGEPPTGPGSRAVPGEPAAAALADLVEAIARLAAAGGREEPRRRLTAALRVAEEHGFAYVTMQSHSILAVCAAVEGDYRPMTAAGEAALACAAANGWAGSVWASTARALLAGAALLRADPDEARRLAAHGLRAGATGISRPIRFALRCLHGCAVFDAGQRAAGFEEMSRARSDAGSLPLAGSQAAGSALLEYRAALALGRLEAAAATLEWLLDRVGECAETALMRAWGEAGQGRPDAARAVLEPVLSGDLVALVPVTPVEALLADAEYCSVVGRWADAERAVAVALAQAAPLDLIRPFVMAGAAVRGLLQDRRDASDAVRVLLDRALRAGHAPQHTDAGLQLSEREQTVLGLLPSLLSLEEIAEDLSISVNTLKSHLRSIYLKLGASSRRGAVLAAQERELITVSLPLVR